MSTITWIYGRSGSGKSTIAEGLRMKLLSIGDNPVVIDGDVLRKGLCNNLGYDQDDRIENVRRAAHLANAISSLGHTTICCLMTPLVEMREMVEQINPHTRFVHLDCSTDVCEERDPKGIYQKYNQGLISNLPGKDLHFDDPDPCDDRVLSIDTMNDSVAQCVEKIWRELF